MSNLDILKNIDKAKAKLKYYYELKNPTETDDFEYVEALKYLCDNDTNPEYLTDLGGYYYGKKKFDLAEKYYLLASRQNEKYAFNGLGYIYYYGRNGVVDYNKAFYHYEKASLSGIDEATVKLSDMYKNGYGTEKDLVKSKNILLKLLDKIENDKNVYCSYPEVAIRLSSFLIEENKLNTAYNMLYKAKRYVAARLYYNDFFGEYTNMSSILNNMYKCIGFDAGDMDTYDLMYYFANNVGDVSFYYNFNEYIIHAEKDEERIAIKFEDKWYRDVREFFMKAKINGKRISSIAHEIIELEVL